MGPAAGLREIPVAPLAVERFDSLVDAEEMAEMRATIAQVRQAISGRAVWNINSTATGGGVAEMLPTLLGYALGSGLKVHWLVIQGDPPFYAVTKRIHNGLHGNAGDGGLLGTNERTHFEEVAKANWQMLEGRLSPGDVVIVHDPQPAGLIPHLKHAGMHVIWRSHIGADVQTELVHRSWQFLKPYVEAADVLCFTRTSYAPPWADPARLVAIMPSIDPFTPKNQELDPGVVRAVVSHAGLIAYCGKIPYHECWLRGLGGDQCLVRRHADILHAGPLPPPEAPMVAQVSR